MQIFWDISPISTAPPATMADFDGHGSQRRAISATYLLTQSGLNLGGEFASDATRESMMRWASEEDGAPKYVGRARVIDVRGAMHIIRPQHLAPHLFGKVTRVFIKTRLDYNPTSPVFSADAIRLLANCGVKLIGIDAPSLDAPASMTQEAFKTAQQLGICVMTNMSLDDVAEGEYELLALPIGTEKARSVQELEKEYAQKRTTRAA